MKTFEPLFSRFNCFSDVPFSGMYKALDKKFPGSRFILTTRDPEKWWQSTIRHWKLAEGEEYTLDPFEEIQYRQYEPVDKRVITHADKDVQIEKFNMHNRSVCEYFSGREECLLVIDLLDSDVNHKISSFLGLETLPYPHVGRGATAASKR